MAEKNIIQLLVELGVIKETDEPINVMLEPLTDIDAKFTGPPQDDLETFYRQSVNDPFWATLGHAIQAYSRLELSLCRLFEVLTGMSNECADMIFYRINNANTVHQILKTLAKQKFGEMYCPFWLSILALISNVTQQRNLIVHWRAGIHPHKKEIQLTIPRKHWLKDIGEKDYLNTSHLIEFIAKCAFIQNQIRDFLMMQDEFWKQRLKPEVLTALQSRFQREIVFTAPKPTPSAQILGAPFSPPPPTTK